MNTDQFILDLRTRLRDGDISQTEISRRSHVSQSTISKIVAGKKSILLSTTIKLWPVIYGCPFPLITTPPGDAGEEAHHAPQEAQDA